jgi:hypothetical protein
MTPEERELLTQSIKLAEENNKMLRGIRRSNRVSTFFRVLYWMIILGTAFGAYYAIQPRIQPYLEIIIKNYSGMKDTVDSIKKVTDKLPVATSSPSTGAKK